MALRTGSLRDVVVTGGGTSFSTSAELAAILSDESGSGALAFSSAVLTNPATGDLDMAGFGIGDLAAIYDADGDESIFPNERELWSDDGNVLVMTWGSDVVGFPGITSFGPGEFNISDGYVGGDTPAGGINTTNGNVYIGDGAMIGFNDGQAVISYSDTLGWSFGADGGSPLVNAPIGDSTGVAAIDAGARTLFKADGFTSAITWDDGEGNTLFGNNAITVAGAAWYIYITGEASFGAGGVTVSNTGDLIAATLETNGTVILNSLPASDPGVAGQLWKDSGALKVSAGP